MFNFYTLYKWFTKGSEPQSLVDRTGSTSDPFALWGEKSKVNSSRALESYNGLVYACTRAICEEIANMRYVVKKVKRDGSDEVMSEHDVVDALEGFNPGTTGYEAKYKTSAHLELCGNAYWYLEGVKNELGKPTAIYILNPGRVKQIYAKDSFPKKLLAYEYRDGNRKITFQPYEILHFRYPDPDNDETGVGTVQSIATWIDADNYANEVNRRYFLNGARIGGYLESETTLSPIQTDQLKKSFEDIHSGVNAAYKTAVLPKGVKYTAADSTAKDMDFANLSAVMGSRILAGFRVPKSVLGISEDVNRANAEAGSYIFALRTIKPKMQQIIAQLNEFFVPRYGSDIFLDFEDPVPENTQIRIQQMQASTGNKPIMTQNEAREYYFGLEPLDGGDTIIPANVGMGGVDPLKPTIDDGAEVKSKNETKKVRQTYVKTRAYKRAEKRSEVSDAFTKATMEALTKTKAEIETVQQKSFKELKDEDWEVLWKAMVDRNGKYQKRLDEAFVTIFENQKTKAIKNLPNAIKGFVTKAIDPSKLLNKNAEVNATVDLITPIYEDLYQTEGQAAAKIVGQSVNLLDSEAYRKALKKVIDLLAENYTDTTITQLTSKLDAGLQAGATMNDLTDIVSTTFDGWSDTRAASTAQTETFRIANQATKDAWKETGVVKSIKWYTANDEKVCEFCGPEDGTVISIEDNFYTKGDTLTGADGGTLDINYSDVGAPPLHVNCRCYSRPEEITIGD